MLKRLPLVALAAIALAGGAHSAEKPKEVGQYVDLQPVNLKAGADVTKIRDKEPAFRDALVRDGHRTPFVLATDWQKVDEPKLIAVMTREASAITGPGVVASVAITSQVPQKRVMPPRPAPVDRP